MKVLAQVGHMWSGSKGQDQLKKDKPKIGMDPFSPSLSPLLPHLLFVLMHVFQKDGYHLWYYIIWYYIVRTDDYSWSGVVDSSL